MTERGIGEEVMACDKMDKENDEEQEEGPPFAK
jgi:hypothetical protein